MLHSLFYLEAALYVSGGASTHHQEGKQLYLQNLVFVTPLLLPAVISNLKHNCKIPFLCSCSRDLVMANHF